jgi:hypothetical protein
MMKPNKKPHGERKEKENAMDGISKKGKKCGRTQWRTSLPP